MSYHEYTSGRRHYNGHRLLQPTRAEVIEQRIAVKNRAHAVLIELLDRMGNEKYMEWVDAVIDEKDDWSQITEKALQAHKDLDCGELFQEVSELRQF